jgi:hypothetical protein
VSTFVVVLMVHWAIGEELLEEVNIRTNFDDDDDDDEGVMVVLFMMVVTVMVVVVWCLS